MPIRKQDAYQALELLEQYYNRLDSQEDKQLKSAIDRVIKVFKSRLFQALIDIQEFYESVLLDENTDPNVKTAATHQFAEECEKQPLLKRDLRKNPSANSEPTVIAPIIANNPVVRSSNTTEDSKRQPTPTPFSQITDLPNSTKRQNKTDLNASTDVTQFNYDDHWKEIVVDLNRLPGKGLGFSIAGGTDTPCINESAAVVITRITEGGIADKDRRLKQHDIILRVNNIDFTNIEHQLAVDTLKAAESPVIVKVRRLEPPTLEEIVLDKPPNEHLGFSIAGGISHEHVKGDYGIFITLIIPGGIADKNGRLKVGDRLMSVQSMKNIYDLEFVEHKHAVESIRRACEEGHKIILVVGHPLVYSVQETIPSINTSIKNPLLSKNEKNGHLSTDHDDLEELSAERRVQLRRGANGFGFNIISSEVGKGIFISFIQSGGAADKSGLLRKGDQILFVNNIDLQAANHEDAGLILKTCGDMADIHVIYKYDEFLQCQSRSDGRRSRAASETIGGATNNLKTTTRRQFFVQAEFDYDPARDPNLPGGPGIKFSTGDILHVINAVDDSWWQARRVIDGKEEEIGIIPSKSRVEKRERARQKRVNFNQRNSRNNSVDSEKKKKKKLGLFNKGGDRKDAQSGEDTENESENLESAPSYQLVVQHKIDYPRPIIIFGPFKEVISDQLINEHPEQFATCIPHTTRPKRDHEIDGKDYHFVTNRKQMEEDFRNHLFIEAGEYGGNLYGTSILAVHDVVKNSKHCVLDVSGRAIRRLIKGNLLPIAIYVKPRDVQWILENMGDEANEENAKRIYEKCNEIEQQFGDLFTATIEQDNLNDAYERICEVIDHENTVDLAWVPSDEKI